MFAPEVAADTPPSFGGRCKQQSAGGKGIRRGNGAGRSPTLVLRHTGSARFLSSPFVRESQQNADFVEALAQQHANEAQISGLDAK